VVQPEGLVVSGQPPAPGAPTAPQPPAPGQEAFTGIGAGAPPAPGGYTQPALPGGPNPVMDYLMFKRMSPPILLIVLFWLGIAYILVSGLAQLVFSIQTMSQHVVLLAFPGAGVWGLFTSLLYLATAPLLWRIVIETCAAVARLDSKK
jgi:hypothetical protein